VLLISFLPNAAVCVSVYPRDVVNQSERIKVTKVTNVTARPLYGHVGLICGTLVYADSFVDLLL